MSNQNLRNKDLLLFLREKTLLGYGGIAKNGAFNWQESAAIIDEYLNHPTRSSIKKIKVKLQNKNPNCWTYRLQVADPTPIPASFDVNLIGQTQMMLIDAVDEIPYIAKNTGNVVLDFLTWQKIDLTSAGSTISSAAYDFEPVPYYSEPFNTIFSAIW